MFVFQIEMTSVLSVFQIAVFLETELTSLIGVFQIVLVAVSEIE